MKQKSTIFLLVIVSLLVSALPVAQADQIEVPSFAAPQFENRWLYSDRAVLDHTGLNQRSWTWGPNTYSLPDGGITESYLEASGGFRKVQYFDKARMELNEKASPGSLFEVTAGLLVKELVSGMRQDGDNSYSSYEPSTQQVAGDPNEGGANASAPVYASFRNVVTLNGENGAVARSGQKIDQSISREGTIKTINPPENKALYGRYEPSTHHNIADVFVRFAAQQGLVWTGNRYETGSPFFNEATYVFGYPICEPYWVRAVVAGQEKDVLVQLFERRVLTFTPSNSDPYKVEMGNTGQHYFQWRYSKTTDSTAAKVTLADSGKTIYLHLNESLVLLLGSNYLWNVNVVDPAIISRVLNITPVMGSQGVYEAHKTGATFINAVGDLPCGRVKPRCLAPSIEFQIQVVVQ